MAEIFLNKTQYDLLQGIYNRLGGSSFTPSPGNDNIDDLITATLSLLTPLNAINAITVSLQNQIGGTNEAMATTPNSVSGTNGLLRLIAERCGTVINNTGNISLYTDTLEERTGNVTETIAANYNASSGLNGLLRLIIKTLVDDFTKLNGIINPIEKYHISDEESGGTVEYYGKVANNGAWFILKIDTVAKTYRYANGSSNYTTGWTGRAGLTYQYFYQIIL